MFTQVSLMRQACLAFAGQSDIYSDARECRPAVLRAENLSVLARALAGARPMLFDCSVYADGDLAFDAKVSIDGLVEVPTGTFGPRGYTGADTHAWTLCLNGHDEVFRLALFADEDSQEAAWILDEAEAFYRVLLKDAV